MSCNNCTFGIAEAMEDVRQFHEVYMHPILPGPGFPPAERQTLRMKLFRDEYIEELDPAWTKIALASNEYMKAKRKDLPPDVELLAELGDVIADLIYYLLGMALEYGLPLEAIWAAVQTANMSKLWTEDEWTSSRQTSWRAHPRQYQGKLMYVVYDKTGKVRKPPSWKEPDIVGIVRKAMDLSPKNSPPVA